MLSVDETTRFINLFSKFAKVPKRELTTFLENNDMSNLLKRPQSLTLDPKLLEKIAEINELRQLMHVGLQTTKAAITSPSSIYNNLIKFADFTDKEYFLATFLNTKNHIIKTEVMGIGTMNAALIDVKSLGKKAILCDAANAIISHNHPSGDPTPSNEDIQITKKIYAALKMVDVVLLDHIILGEGKYQSLKEKGIFESMPKVSFSLAENRDNIYMADEKPAGNTTKQQGGENQSISFYVAECMEFTNHGEYHANLNLDQAVKLFEAIPDKRLNAGKGIGFTLHNHNETRAGFETTSFGLYSNGRIDMELINMIPEFKNNPLVQQAIWDVAKYFPDGNGIKDKDNLKEVGQAGKGLNKTTINDTIKDRLAAHKEKNTERSAEPKQIKASNRVKINELDNQR